VGTVTLDLGFAVGEWNERLTKLQTAQQAFMVPGDERGNIQLFL
jgi:hypothetical protein